MYSVHFQESLYTPVRQFHPESPPSYIEEPFPDWLEEKIDLPIYDDLPPPPTDCLDIAGVKAFPSLDPDAIPLKAPSLAGPGCRAPQPAPFHPAPVDQTSAFLRELDYGLGGGGGAAAHDTLTPPESPRDGDLVFTLLQEMRPDELDELVRARADVLVEDAPPSSAYESDSAASPCSSDPDWAAAERPAGRRSRRPSKPYARPPPEERRQRKKEQNKNAATRYRMKKKQEVEEILGEEKGLLAKNENLKRELTELARETKYLKNLMRELFRAKGLVK